MHQNLRLWLDHPVSKVYVRKIQEERDSLVRQLLDMTDLDPTKLAKVAELKGNIKGLEKLLETDELELLLEDEKFE